MTIHKIPYVIIINHIFFKQRGESGNNFQQLYFCYPGLTSTITPARTQHREKVDLTSRKPYYREYSVTL